MTIIVKGKEGSNYTPHPVGQFPAACVDVVDLGWEDGKFGLKYKIRISFFCGRYTDEKEIDGVKKRFPMLVSQKFTASLHDKANLRAFCRSWRGQDFTPDVVRDGFDFDKMVGAVAFIQVSHNETSETTYANIESIMRLPEGMEAPASPTDFQRVSEREGWPGPTPHPALAEPDPSEAPTGYTAPDDFDLPF